MASKKKAPTAAPAPDQAAVAADVSTFQTLAVKDIRKSPTNRKRFNEEALQELAANVKVNGVIQPVLVRPVTPAVEQPEPYELVAGERRWRASVIAGIETIPALVRVLSDSAAAELQILENLQREDPHPIEEAEGYEQLMMKHGYTADQLAEKINKSRSYVYGRLKLCALCPVAREQFYEGKIPASTALLIARIPVPELQAKALQEIIEPHLGATEPMSYRRAVAHIEQRYMLDLDGAVFDPKDAKLLASAGSCKTCPKRTGNQPEIFPGVSADVCTDPDCFAEKRAAHFGKVIVIANKKGTPVYEGAELDAALRDQNNATAGTAIYYFRRQKPGKYGNAGSFLSAEQLPKPIALGKEPNGDLIEIYRKADLQAALEKAGACETEAEADAAHQRILNDPQRKEEQERRNAEVDRQRKVVEAEAGRRRTLYLTIREHIAAHGMSLVALREFAKAMVLGTDDGGFCLPEGLLKDVYGFAIDRQLQQRVSDHIDQAEPGEIQLLMMDVVFGESLDVGQWFDPEDVEPTAITTLRAIAAADGIELPAEETAPAAATETELPEATGDGAGEPLPSVGDEARTAEAVAWPFPEPANTAVETTEATT
jgi:ParB/RepB/Spo0J family partition protein